MVRGLAKAVGSGSNNLAEATAILSKCDDHTGRFDTDRLSVSLAKEFQQTVLGLKFIYDPPINANVSDTQPAVAASQETARRAVYSLLTVIDTIPSSNTDHVSLKFQLIEPTTRWRDLGLSLMN